MKWLRFFGLIVALIYLQACKGIKEPDFKEIEQLRVHQFGLGNSTLKFYLRYYNPNRFGLKLRQAEGDAWIDERFAGRWTVDSLVQVSPLSEFRIPVKLKIDMGSLVTNSISAILGKEIRIRIEGTARLGKGFVFINYPFKYSGKHKLLELID